MTPEDDTKCTRTDCKFYTGYYDKKITACGAGIYKYCALRRKEYETGNATGQK